MKSLLELLLCYCFSISLPSHFHSPVAPICYAHLAAYQTGQFMKFEDLAETFSGSATSVGSTPIPELPRLHKNVKASMFFC